MLNKIKEDQKFSARKAPLLRAFELDPCTKVLQEEPKSRDDWCKPEEGVFTGVVQHYGVFPPMNISEVYSSIAPLAYLQHVWHILYKMFTTAHRGCHARDMSSTTLLLEISLDPKNLRRTPPYLRFHLPLGLNSQSEARPCKNVRTEKRGRD
ncbi:hypothetical protein D5086_010254 [Populus alba]|uniref:Uncharacterized protein n=1 Tax=Populus alba TaxID=43335 RepID=A0ACC4C963_POPAL